ncbi:hypothetical protein C0Q92_30895 [Streptomyces albidoflavus]|uniref:Uncharacterized protein n=1 Tax=Streptomyces albidoflavus TaxID=1886 RepID=A0A8G1ZLG8_9ACTN|nr:hypothetical protein C0Q92_30895 [Streptomyces albidoflavus]
MGSTTASRCRVLAIRPYSANACPSGRDRPGSPDGPPRPPPGQAARNGAAGASDRTGPALGHPAQAAGQPRQTAARRPTAAAPPFRPRHRLHRNLKLLGRYSFTASTPAAGALRPLRDPDAPELDEDEDESAAD